MLLDEASIQRELKDIEDKNLEANKMMQSIFENFKIEEIIRSKEAEYGFAFLDTLLETYDMRLKNLYGIARCNIKICRGNIPIIKNKLYHIRNHWEIHHGPKNKIYNEVKNDRAILNIL